MRRFVVLALLLGMMTILQTLQAGSDTTFNPLSLATFGFVLLTAYTLGQVAATVQLPKITGYIVTGLVFGPQILNIFSGAVEADLRVVNDLAIGLIALSAGAEMQLSGLKRIARSLFWIVAIKGLLILVMVTAAVYGLASMLPFLAGQPVGLVLSVGMILGVMAVGTSPAATIAVINETGAKGRLADTTLGVAVAKDIVMVVLLALGIALARTFSPDGHGFEVAILGELAFELGLSLLAGVILGAVIIAYVRYLGAELWLFVVGIIFATTAIAHEFHLEALLVFIVAGFVVQNGSKLGHDFVHLVERVALPIYVVFFSVAGAGLDLGALQSVLLVALALVAVRLLAIFVGTRIATGLADEPPAIRRYAWLSFVSQAGVVIGLSIIVENNLPGIGAEIRTLVMGTVAIHLLLGPILFKLALTRAGEVRGDAEEDVVAEEEPEAPLGALTEELTAPFAVLDRRVREALEGLASAGTAPLALAEGLHGWPDEDRAEKEAAVADFADLAAGELRAAVERFYGDVHAQALAAPRQIKVELEPHWFENSRWDTGSERWLKRLRRFRRGLRRLSGAKPVLHRTVPFRSLALYHLDNALADDLRPVVTWMAAQPALSLRDSLRRRAAMRDAGDPGDTGALPEHGESPGALREALEVLTPVTEKRFRQLQKELSVVGTAELPSRRRRPSTLHERAQRARARTGSSLLAWDEYARAVIEHEQRREAIEALRAQLKSDAGAFESDLEARFDEVLIRPAERARQVVRDASARVEALENESAEAVEEGLYETSEWLSLSLRRQALAGLRRGIESRPLREVLRNFDDLIESRLDQLPEHFRVVDPETLPDPTLPPRTYPETANHAFKLIATGAVERTLRPSLAELAERGGQAIAEAARDVQEVRDLLELRFDAAIDAAMEEGRAREERGGEAESIRIALRALETAADTLDATGVTLSGLEEEALKTTRGDFEALSDRLSTQLASARPLEARLQAERARVELEGTAVARLILRKVRKRIRGLLERLGFGATERPDRGSGERAAPEPLKPAGRAGSDRAVLFHILFDDTTAAGKVFGAALIFMIIGSIVVLMLESVEPIRIANGTSLTLLEWMFTLFFTVEYLARLWAVDRPARYAFSFFGIVDFLAVMPTYISLLLPGGQYLMGIRVLRVIRAFRVFKLVRYVGEAQVLADALRASRYKITVFLTSVLSVAVVVGSAMYLIEGPSSGFTSIPRAVYWSIVTLTTVGFGDITPQSPLGQALAAVLMVLGYGIIAVPTGIVTSELATHSRDSGHSRLMQTCPQCGHRESNPTAAHCLICGTALSGD